MSLFTSVTASPAGVCEAPSQVGTRLLYPPQSKAIVCACGTFVMCKREKLEEEEEEEESFLRSARSLYPPRHQYDGMGFANNFFKKNLAINKT